MHGGGGLPPGGGCIAELGVSCAESTTSEFARALVVRSPHPDTPTPLARLLRACSPAPRNDQRRMRHAQACRKRTLYNSRVSRHFSSGICDICLLRRSSFDSSKVHTPRVLTRRTAAKPAGAHTPPRSSSTRKGDSQSRVRGVHQQRGSRDGSHPFAQASQGPAGAKRGTRKHTSK